MSLDKLGHLPLEDRDVLSSIRRTFITRKKFRVAAVYFLFDNQELVYIGSARCLHGRMAAHLNDSTKHFNGVAWHEAPESEIIRLEQRLIGKLWPIKYNKTYRYNHSVEVWVSDGIRSSIIPHDDGAHVRCEYYDFQWHRGVYVEEIAQDHEQARHVRKRLVGEALGHIRHFAAIDSHRCRKRRVAPSAVNIIKKLPFEGDSGFLDLRSGGSQWTT